MSQKCCITLGLHGRQNPRDESKVDDVVFNRLLSLSKYCSELTYCAIGINE